MQAANQQFHQVQHVEVGSSANGQRIDNFLMGKLKTAPRSLVYRLLRTGQVRVNKGRVKPGHKLVTGDLVRIPPVTLSSANIVHLPKAALTDLEKSVISVDEHWIVINKPCGLAVHAGTGVSFGVVDLAQKIFDDKEISLVHRLDRETSGCLVLAKNRPAAVFFQQSLRDGLVKKHYTALVAGELSQDFVERAPLTKNQPQDGERMVVVDNKQGKSALSRFKPVTAGGSCSRVNVEIETGRTHQIRVHAAHRGHPVLGDARYGNRELNRRAAGLGAKRMFLHAALLEFPGFGKNSADTNRFEAVVPDSWEQTMTTLNS